MSDPVSMAGAIVGAGMVAKPAKTVLSNLFAQLLQRTGQRLGNTLDKLFADFQIGSSDFLEKSYNRCANIKTLLSGDEPISLLSVYVHLSLKCNSEIILDDELISEIDRRRFVAIVGLAGSGKSMFMRYLTICRFNNPLGKIPLFVELRHLNKLKEPNLIEFIRTSCGTGGNSVSANRFKHGLIAGGFHLILDGFDEVEQRIREEVANQIRALSEAYPANSIAVSSRPDARFSTWQNCHVMIVQKLPKNSIKELISKTDYDDEVKKRFISEIERVLYRTHRTFLEVPLLATMMLLTYRQNAEISSKIHLFYKQAFDTLFTKHDANKEQFLREKFSGLSSDDFENCFAAFWAAAYLDGRIDFNERQALEYAKRASEFCGIKLTPKEFIRDLKETVCLLQQDGTQLAYVHRSFQEYFAALFISRYSEKNIHELIRTVALRHDDVTKLLFSLNRDILEKHWILPKIEEFIAKYESSIKNKRLRGVASEFNTFVVFGPSNSKGSTVERAHLESELLTLKMSTTRGYTLGLIMERILLLYGREIKSKPLFVYFTLIKGTHAQLRRIFGASSLTIRETDPSKKSEDSIDIFPRSVLCQVSKIKPSWFLKDDQIEFYIELLAKVSAIKTEINERRKVRHTGQISNRFV